MEFEIASLVFNWLLHIDLGCIVCNWDPARGWVPAAGAATAAGGLSLSDLFGPFYDVPTLQIPGGGSDPLDPASYPSALGVGQGRPAPDYAATPPDADSSLSDDYPGSRAEREAYNRAREAIRPFPSDFRPNPTDNTPPPPQTIWEDADDYIYDSANEFFHTMTGL